MPHYLILDVETSGLFDYSLAADAPGQPRAAQIGMVFVNHALEIEAEYEFLIKPDGWAMDPEATRVTGLTTEHLLEHGVPIKDALQLYTDGIKARRVVAGFNVQFDLKIGRAELRHARMEDNYLQTRHMCLMWGCRAIVGARSANGAVKVPKLEEACAHFGIEQPKAHSALADARSVYQLMLRLTEQGALPEPKSPYDKKAKKPPAAKTVRVARAKPESDAEAEIPGLDLPPPTTEE